MSDRKRVLLFAPYFLPRRRVGSMRPFRFALHLAEFGWEPTVLTIKTSGQQLTPKEAELLRDIPVLTVDPPFDRTASSESQLGQASRGGRGREGAMSRALHVLDRQFPVDTWMLLFAARFPSMLDQLRAIAPHVIWATGDPWSGLVFGRHLSTRLRIPYVADFRDPWTLSEIRSDGLWPVSRWLDAAQERAVIDAADVVMFQAERVEAAYREAYSDLRPRTITIRNSFDPSVFDDPVGRADPPDHQTGATLRIGFFGRFRAMSPATLIADALAELTDTDPEKGARVMVHSFGPLSEEDARYSERIGVRKQFVQEDAVPLEKALSVLRTFDLLLVSTEERRERIIPAKIFEYLAAGRPILSLSRNPEVADLIKETRTGVQLNDTALVARLLSSCVEAMDRGEPFPIPFEPDPEAINRYDARTTTRELARVLDSLVGQGDGISSPTSKTIRSTSRPKDESAGSES